MHIEAKLKELGYDVQPAVAGASKIEPAVRTGNLIFTSGQVSARGDVSIKGKVGGDLTVEQGYEAAQLCALNALSAILRECGDLDRVTRFVKVLGMVNAADGFTDTPGVIHGCTDLLNTVFGPRGRHARSAVGVYQLPSNYAVEIEMIVEVAEAK
jgi:enamine deaminase RidA (YjgF/YER057c/UK114 family)